MAQEIYLSPRNIINHLRVIETKIPRNSFSLYSSLISPLQVNEDVLAAETRQILAFAGLEGYQADVHIAKLEDGVEVITRTDYNYGDVADGIVRSVLQYAAWSPQQVEQARNSAAELSQKALWKHFIQYYYEAYDIALKKAIRREESMNTIY